MQNRIRSLLMASLTALALAPVLPASAQTPGGQAAPGGQATPAQTATPPGTRPERAIQRIRTEDAGTKIDELRVGGETQSITVQPKTDMPAYEVQPTDQVRGAGSTGTSGSRVWRVLKF